MIEVVTGVIIQGNRVLLTQRRADKPWPFAWETPGGKVEWPESQHAALKRELNEELGIEVGGLPEIALWAGVIAGETDEFSLVCFVVPEWTGAPTPKEGQGMGWFTAADMSALKLTPRNNTVFDRIAAILRAKEEKRY